MILIIYIIGLVVGVLAIAFHDAEPNITEVDKGGSFFLFLLSMWPVMVIAASDIGWWKLLNIIMARIRRR